MHVASLVVSLIASILSFFQGGFALFIGGIGSGLGGIFRDRTMTEVGAVAAGTGLLLVIAAIIGIVGGILAVLRKKEGRFVLLASMILSIIADFVGFKYAMLWAFAYFAAAGLSEADLDNIATKGSQTSDADARIPADGADESKSIPLAGSSTEQVAGARLKEEDTASLMSASPSGHEMKCDFCGTTFRSETRPKFCTNCGAKFPETTGDSLVELSRDQQVQENNLTILSPVAPQEVPLDENTCTSEALGANSHADAPFPGGTSSSEETKEGALTTDVATVAIRESKQLSKEKIFNFAVPLLLIVLIAVVLWVKVDVFFSPSSPAGSSNTLLFKETAPVSVEDFMKRIWSLLGAEEYDDAQYDILQLAGIEIPKNPAPLSIEKQEERDFVTNAAHLYKYPGYTLHVLEYDGKKHLLLVEFSGKSPFFEPGVVTRKKLTSLFGEQHSVVGDGSMQAYNQYGGSWTDYTSGLLFSFDGIAPDSRVIGLVAGLYFYSKEGRRFKNQHVISKEDRRIKLIGKNINMRARPTVNSPVVRRLKGNEKLWILKESVEERQVHTKEPVIALYNGDTYRIPKGRTLTTGGPVNLDRTEIGVYETRQSDGKRIGFMVPTSVLDSWTDKIWAKVTIETGETGWVISDYIEEYQSGLFDGDYWEFMVGAD